MPRRLPGELTKKPSHFVRRTKGGGAALTESQTSDRFLEKIKFRQFFSGTKGGSAALTESQTLEKIRQGINSLPDQ